jgi:hypothetical protein
MNRAMLAAAMAGALAFSTQAQVKTTPPAAPQPAKPTPRAADGHPDLSGVWWLGGDVGGSGLQLARGGTKFSDLYTPAAAAKAKSLGDKDDPTLGCVSTAFGTLGVSMFDVGAVGQIVQTPKFVIILTETFHEFQIIPFDGRPHRDNVPPSYRGDAIAHWDGDTLVVDKTNFADNTWITAEGRVTPHSDALHIVERYRRTDSNTLEVEATLEDPKMLTKPWVVPKQTLKLAPFDQIMELNCTAGDTPELVEAASKADSKK